MKKLWLVLALLLVGSTSAFANNEPFSVQVGEIEILTLNSIGRWEKEWLIVFMIVRPDTPMVGSIMLVATEGHSGINRVTLHDNKQIMNQDFVEALQKHLEWEAIATREKMEVKRNITTLSVYPNWQKYGDWYSSKRLTQMSIGILSQNTTRHQLTISFLKVASSTNQYIEFEPKTWYLEKDQVVELLKLLDPEFIKKQIEADRADRARKDSLFQ
jgi:hypothetical protein